MSIDHTGSTPPPSHQETKAARNNGTSLRRALDLIDLIADRQRLGPMGLGDLSVSLGVHKSTALRLLAPLVDAGLVQRVGPSDYALGPTTIRWGQAYLGGLDLRTTAHPILMQLSEATQETIHLVVYDPPVVVYIEKIDSPQTVRMHSRVGDRQPIYCTAVGKAYLARLRLDSLGEVISPPLQGRTPHTVTEWGAFQDEIRQVAERGFAIDDQENELEIRCVGAAILDHKGDPAAGVSVSAPASRLTMPQAIELGGLVTRAASSISALLGNPESLQSQRTSGHLGADR